MAALVCGSLAFDSIATFPGRFADQILPHQLHILNVSFLVPTMRREFGGCAGNIAYNLAALGGDPVLVAAVGSDGAGYLERLAGWGATTEHVRTVEGSLTAQAIIITDLDNNQITAFHPGAMQSAHETAIPARSDIAVAIVAPDGREAMLTHAAQLVEAGVPFVFDPGQGLPMFNAAELRRFVAQASWVALNDYEAQMLAERTGESLESLSRSHLKGIVVTLGAEGCELWQAGVKTPRASGRGERGRRPDGLRRRVSKRLAVRARARLAAPALRRTGQPAGRLEDRQPRRAESRAGSHAGRDRRRLRLKLMATFSEVASP